MKTYSELIKLPTFNERFRYLKLEGQIGEQTFGFDRYLNQSFYRKREWKRVRDYVITRDNACDLGIEGREIPNGVRIYIHHLNPIDTGDIVYITGGEKDVMSLAAHGFSAVSLNSETARVPESVISSLAKG